VATKKRRRSQLARASAQRQLSRRAQRLARRRRWRLVATAVGILVVLVALAIWILTHREDSASAHARVVDYAFVITQPQDQATSTGGFR
jgi:hypothetical protein